jgi:hypothetical protein
MLSEKLEKLKSEKRREKLSQILCSIDSNYSKELIQCLNNSNYQDLLHISYKHIVDSFDASGSRVKDVNIIYDYFIKVFNSFYSEYGDSKSIIDIPFDNDFFEVNTTLGVILKSLNKLLNNFFLIDEKTSREVLVYNENLSIGLCLFIEEHRYYISVWNSVSE